MSIHFPGSVMFRSLLIFVAMGTSLAVDSQESTKPDSTDWELIEVRKIWDEAPHNAFTDLIRFKDHWYCAFREGTAHRSPDGRLRVIRTNNWKDWENVALFGEDRAMGDWREAKFSITPDGSLMLTGAITFKDDPERIRESITMLSQDGTTWSGPHTDSTSLNTWRWRTTWHDGFGYSFGYSAKDKGGHLYRTRDGINWESVAENVYPVSPDGTGGEAAIHFQEDGTAYCLLRREPVVENWAADAPGSSAQLGVSKPPYTQWEWKDLGVRMGGPILSPLKDGRIVSVVRLYWMPRTVLLEIDLEKATATELLNLPSKRDSSYAGIYEEDGILWITYYSSHEEKTSIYLAKVKIPPKE